MQDNGRDEPVKITSNLSQYASVKIGFSFSRVDGYVKNSEIGEFYFLKAQKPDGFVPVEPEQMVIIEQLAEHGFARAELQKLRRLALMAFIINL